MPDSKVTVSMSAEALVDILHHAYDLGAHAGVNVFCRTVLAHGGVPPAGVFDKAIDAERVKDLNKFEEIVQDEIERRKKEK